jgi:hypothetical protein
MWSLVRHTIQFNVKCYRKYIKITLVHSNHVFATKVQLLSKSTHFANTYVVVLCVTKSQVLIITYVIMKQMDCKLYKCNYNFWVPCGWITKLMKVIIFNQLLLDSIDGWKPSHFCNCFNIFFPSIHRWLNHVLHQVCDCNWLSNFIKLHLMLSLVIIEFYITNWIPN